MSGYVTFVFISRLYIPRIFLLNPHIINLEAQAVKNLPAVQKTWVRSPDREDPLEKEMATNSVFWPGKSHGQRSLVGYSLWGCKELDMTEAT